MIPNEIAAKYELRGTLGSGAMGIVYDCLDRNIQRRVAIKVVRLPPAGDPEGEEAHGRFRREAQAAGRLSHPNIVGVYDYGENAETAWIVMELVEGGSLKDRLDRKERFPVPEIARIMQQVLAALAYSHGRGVVHRDIKPGNIMLAQDAGEGATVKMADFGIARLENSSMTHDGTVMGTPSYMAPEQLRGETVDARADIWAAGVMLYQLLTGEKPFEGGFSAVMHKALHTEPSPPSQLSVTAPRAFDAVITKALAKRPEDRYATAVAFAAAIRAAASAPAAAGAEATGGGGFAGAGTLPGLDTDATMVGAPAGGPRPLSGPAPVVPPARPGAAGGAKKRPIGLIAGGLGALAVAGVAAFLLLGDGRQAEEQRLEQLRQSAAREATERQRAAAAEQSQAQRDQAPQDQAQQDQASQTARAAAEQRAREEQARLV
ncbi:MAG: Serine/threonine protein kinase, partial [Belnapia sp.]|nr:Serine/threonine protein kinase [Belnapia sp.]